ncbi:hypothetical protein ABIC09_002720 [Bradyrhizobium sp. S3.12.5]
MAFRSQSVWRAPSIWAKIASQVAKPDGLVVVDPDTELEFPNRLPVELMWEWARSKRHGFVFERERTPVAA